MRVPITARLIVAVSSFVIFLIFSGNSGKAQNVNYTPLFTSSNFGKTIDPSKPVGVIGGSAGTTLSGCATYSIPIFTPPGTNGLVPAISLIYNSQAGNGAAGFGWNLSGLSMVSRAGNTIYHNGTVSPVTYTRNDAFVLNGSRLSLISGTYGGNGAIYATESETFAQVTSYTLLSADNPDWFKVVAKDGSVTEFGHTMDSRFLSDDGQSVMFWRISRIIDINGNYIDFKYDNSDRDSRIVQILYTGNTNTGMAPYNEINFSYLIRDDVNKGYDGGASIMSKYLLDKVSIVNGEAGLDETVKTYKLNYGFNNVHSQLKEIIEFGGDESDPSLNSTIFLYGDQPQNMSWYSSGLLTGNFDLFPGDFDADGKSDVLAAQVAMNSAGLKYYPSYSIMSDINDGSGGSLMYSYATPGNSIIGGTYNKWYNFLSNDFNKDGRDDVMFLTADVVENGQSLYFDQWSVTINTTGSHNYQTGYTDYFTRYISYPSSEGLPYQLTKANGKSFVVGDFDGDGNQDYILIARNVFNQYKGFVTSPATNEENLEVGNFGVGSNPYPILEADRIVPIDFDGDGKMELLITKNHASYVLSIKRVSIATGYYFVAEVIWTTNSIVKDDRVFPGDFNGDRKTDLLMHFDNNTWGIFYSDGKSYFGVVNAITFQQPVAVNGFDVIDKIIVADFNGDGKSDVLHGYNYGGTASKLSVYYSRGLSSVTPFYYEQYSHSRILNMSADMVTGDFNGDGRNDLINRFSDVADFIFIKPFGSDMLLKGITHGHNSTVSFDYTLLTDKSGYPYVYDRTIPLEDPANENPFNYIQLPIYVVSTLTEPDCVGGNSISNFYYKDLVMHRAGKGLLGFMSVKSENSTSGHTISKEQEINTQFSVLYPKRELIRLTSTNELLTELLLTNSFVDLSGGPSDVRYFHKVDRTLTVDYLNGKAIESSNTFDVHGNIIYSETKKGVLSGLTVTPTEASTTATEYGVHNTPVPAKADNITVTNLRTGMPSSSATTSVTYTANGLVASRTSFSGLPKAVTTCYTYNSFGNTLTAVTSAAGLNSRAITNTYDAFGRFAVSRELSGINVSQTETYTYDAKWGSMLSVTSPDCLTTNFEYDRFGRLTRTNMPEGYSINVGFYWDVQANSVYYILEEHPGKPDRKTWYDNLGRETTVQIKGFNNRWMTGYTAYNNRGLVASKFRPAYDLEIGFETLYEYDEFNRLILVKNNFGGTEYSYSSLGGGLNKVEVTNPAVQVSSQTTDAAGRVVSANDNGGQLDFSYNSWGNQVEIRHGGTILITAAYDEYGRQTSMTDVNAGTTLYTYDAYGQLVFQKDAKDNQYTMIYDDLGRTVSRTGSEGVTSYEYYKDAVTACNNNRLSRVTGFNGMVKEFTFDEYRRPATEKETIDGAVYITTYVYDPYGRVVRTMYPSGVEIFQRYDDDGYLTHVTDASAIPYFSGIDMNSFGQYTLYRLNNGKISENGYNFGIPGSFYTDGVQDLKFNFDFTSGNLQSRYDGIKDVEEYFGYDNLNRLTSSSISTGPAYPQVAVGYDGNLSYSMGNIVNKTDAGYYTYLSNKVHAVAFTINQPAQGQPAVFPDPVSMISHDQQKITYTPFLKVASVDEADGLYKLDFTYGPDLQRIKSEFRISNVLTETRYYFGNYEKQVKNGVTRELHYIAGGNGLCAILVKENGVVTPYYVYTDYLGSILTVTDGGGSVIGEQNFDAWGRRRNPSDWNVFMPPNDNRFAPGWLYRGFTGHEHHDAFALINMNGRIYDPILGRMLSPDNNITDPFSTQAYNRYTYGINNPLTYVDPDGETFLAVVVAAFIGGAFNVGVQYFRGNIQNFGEGLRAFGFGALGGTVVGLGAASVGSAALNSFISGYSSLLPGINVTVGDNLTLTLSPAVIAGSGAGLGVNVGATIHGDFGGIGVSYGITSYSNHYASQKSFLERRFSYGASVGGRNFHFGLGTTNFNGGGLDQTTGYGVVGGDDWSVSYENDGTPWGEPGGGGVGNGDGQDRFRTAAVTIRAGDFSVGTQIFTGQRDYKKRTLPEPGYPYGRVANPEINNYKFASLYAGYGNYRIGWNHYRIGHAFQNILAHTLISKQAYIPWLSHATSYPNEYYGGYFTANPFTNW